MEPRGKVVFANKQHTSRIGVGEITSEPKGRSVVIVEHVDVRVSIAKELDDGCLVVSTCPHKRQDDTEICLSDLVEATKKDN